MNRRPPAKTLSELGPDAETYPRTGGIASLALGFGALATAVVIIGVTSLTSWEQGQRIDRLHQHLRALETQLAQTQAVVEANSIAASRIGTLAQDASIAANAEPADLIAELEETLEKAEALRNVRGAR